MVPPSVEFVALTFALFRIGAIPILIDPGMGLKKMLHCIEEVEASVFIGISKAHLLRKLFPKPFRTVKTLIRVGKGFGGVPLESLLSSSLAPFPLAETKGADLAGIFFTSGSTGIPKGVEFFHSQMHAQVRFIQDHYQIQPDEIDLPTFPLFLLFSPAFGATCIIPEMDFSHPARVQPEKIIRAIQANGVTYTFGSPALWNRVSRYCIEQKIQLPSVRRVLIAGAPVPTSVIERFSFILPHGEVFTPYGATEALPVCSIGHHEICEQTLSKTKQGAGTCVGKPFSGVTLKIIRISEAPIPEWSEDLELPQGETGEIAVKGPMVTKTYYKREQETLESKIRDGREIWHRMGDVGYQDEQGRIWFCGRKKHRVITSEKTYFSVPVEEIFNAEPDIWRTALVGVLQENSTHLVLCIEFQPRHQPRDPQKRRVELKKIADTHQLPIIAFLFYPGIFPVDRRHNAKIEREELALWAKLWLETGASVPLSRIQTTQENVALS
ncbi:MAG: fatty acid CoA ligase family protein [Planctomycetota bacterium]